MDQKRTILAGAVVVGLLLLGLLLAGCGPTATPAPCPTAAPCPECPEAPECPECPECPEGVEVPFEEAWAGSGHADAEAEAFHHWDEDGEVDAACAKCHSTDGYLDFLGLDGTAAGTVDNNAPIGSVVTCVACHNEATVVMDSVVMPSGIEITGLGDESRCMQCHQGRESTVSVNARIEEAGVADEDTVSENLSFTNIHYYAAAATKYGTMAKGGYEYTGKSYDANFAHVANLETCIDCHDSHTLEVRVEACKECHTDVNTVEDLRAVRMAGSLVDYDGDGDISEGIASELAGLQEMLYTAIQAYAAEVAGSAIVYDSHAYPYFFIDLNGNGEPDADEANFGNRYVSWTPRLLKAAYNYQVSAKDPGAYAHGGKYIIELLYDSIEDLNSAISTPVDLSAAHRTDAGHFAGSNEAFRHWDEDGEVNASCARCHSAGGLPTFLKEGVNVSEPLSNGLQCATCHNDLVAFTRYEVGPVPFPSGATLDSGNADSNLCLNCHQGRESKASVDRAIRDLDDDTVSEGLRFINIHYFAAGATLFGTEAKGIYEYDGNEYLGRFAHVAGLDNCISCHDVHGLTVKEDVCATCHAGIEDAHDIRMATDDFDGDGDTAEGIYGELETYREVLYAAIQAYAADVVGTPIVYDSHAYPYFFTDTNGNGEPDPDEANYGNRYATWTPRLLRAAYNYQYVTKDPGAFAHNGKYVIQVLYDTLVDMGAAVDVDMAGLVRP